MRAALAGLTTRGRCLLAAGATAAVCAIILGESDLLRVAAFVAALPLVSAYMVARTRFRLSSRRRLEPSRVSVGQTATVSLDVTNVSRVPTGTVLLEDALPFTLGGRPRFVVDRVPVGHPSTAEYTVRSELRGRFSLGPLQLRMTDPFGLVELSRSFSGTDTLTVVPKVHPLPHTGLSGAWSTGGESRARSVAIQGEDDTATREYRQGDDLRKVHWRSTARTGKVMVRREEQPLQTRSALLMDTRTLAHRGEGPSSSLEWTITAAASIGVHIGRAGYDLRVFTQTGELRGPGGHDLSHPMFLLDALATVTASSRRELTSGIQALHDSSEDGLLIAVLGDVGPDEVTAIDRAREGSGTMVAVLLDVSDWLPQNSRERQALRDRHDAAARAFRGLGWRVVTGDRAHTIADGWAHAAGSTSAGPPADGLVPR